MIRFPNCKINLGLHVLGKRSDGYHNLETVFFPVPLCDALEILPLQEVQQPLFSLSGLPVAGDNNNNLCLKAWGLLRNDFPQLPPVNIHLHKSIPMGAGLGGGSADGAFMLMMLNETFKLGLSSERLAQYALALGSDCPFFIYNKPSIATGRGEVMEEIEVNLAGYFMYLVYPNLHINTGEAFRELRFTDHAVSVKDIIQQPIETWKENLKNDFEEGIARQHPVIANLKQQLYEQGAVYAAMSGSGSTVFSLFKNEPAALSFPDNYFGRIIKING